MKDISSYSKFVMLAVLALLSTSSCAIQPTESAPAPTQPNNNETPTNSNDELYPFSPNVVYAEGWSDVIVTANMAKTTIDVIAHFNTTRNACGKDAYGSVGLAEWNQFAKGINFAVSQAPLPTETCVPVPRLDKYMDGNVEVKFGQQKRVLFEYKNFEICNNIPNSEIAASLLDSINKIILTADKEDCPFGWGS